ncbi:MAG: lipopolysaccharide biosynthesis protein [Candidatus Abyssubacteria bacterium]
MTESLKTRAVKGTLWLSAGRVLSQLFSWAITIVVARILTPNDYGLMGMAGLIIILCQYFGDVGLGAALIQRKDVEDDDLSSIFWFSIAVSLLLYLIAWSVAPALALFFEAEKLTLLVRVLSLSFVIGIMRTIPVSLINRDLAFDKYSKSDVIATLFAVLTSLFMAVKGFGVWALVSATLTRDVVFNIAIFHYYPWKPVASFNWRRLKSFLGFGSNVLGARMVWVAYSNADYLIVGKLLGSTLLGYYTMAFQLASKPVTKVAEITNTISFTLFSRLQDDLPELRRNFLRLTEIVALLIFPALIGLCCVAEEFVITVLTDKWAPMVFPLQVFCIMGLFRSLSPLIASMLNGRGRPGIVFRYNIACALVMPAAFIVGCIAGELNGVAISWLAVYPPLFFIILGFGLRETETKIREYIHSISMPFVASSIMAASVLITKSIFLVGRVGYWPLAAQCVVGAVTYTIAVFSLSSWVRQQVQEVSTYLRSLRLGKVAVPK